MKKLTLKVKKVAFYNGGLVQPNEIIKNYKGEKVPSWATLLNGNETPRKSNEQKDADNANGKVGSVSEPQTDNVTKTEEVIVAGDGGVHPIPQEGETGVGTDETSKEGETDTNVGKAPEEKTEAELMAEYDALLDEAVEKNIMLEGADTKTIVEQIAELKKLLGKE